MKFLACRGIVENTLQIDDFSKILKSDCFYNNRYTCFNVDCFIYLTLIDFWTIFLSTLTVLCSNNSATILRNRQNGMDICLDVGQEKCKCAAQVINCHFSKK